MGKALGLIVLAAFGGASLPAAAAPAYRVLHAFNGTSEGGGLFGNLLLDGSGNLFGTARDGGKQNYGFGTAFRLSPDEHGGYSNKIIHHFNEKLNYRNPDGLNPSAGLIADARGNLYGTAFYGGEPSDMGVVFELLPDGHGGYRHVILHAFHNEDGRYPSAGLVFDGAGNLYGTTYGVPYQCGTVFRLSPTQDNHWTETVLHDFGPSGGNGEDGCESTSGVVFDAAGNLYGTTSGGGINGYNGIVYELSPQIGGKWKETILHKFTLSEGNLPYAGVTLGAAGELYGTTFGGGDAGCSPIGCGTVFELAPDKNGSWRETPIYSFRGSDGQNPLGGMTLDSRGSLYGTTDYGADQSCQSGCGVVFKLSPAGGGKWKQTLLHAFNGLDGWGPATNLVLTGTGILYGTTITCLGSCFGAVFEITP